MAQFVQYGKIGLPIKYKTLPTPSKSILGVIGEVNNIIYRCQYKDGAYSWGRIGYVSPYTGQYIITPKTIEQVLPTDNKQLDDDIIVKEIPYKEISNPQGGNTIIIGE